MESAMNHLSYFQIPLHLYTEIALQKYFIPMQKHVSTNVC